MEQENKTNNANNNGTNSNSNNKNRRRNYNNKNVNNNGEQKNNNINSKAKNTNNHQIKSANGNNEQNSINKKNNTSNSRNNQKNQPQNNNRKELQNKNRPKDIVIPKMDFELTCALTQKEIKEKSTAFNYNNEPVILEQFIIQKFKDEPIEKDECVSYIGNRRIAVVKKKNPFQIVRILYEEEMPNPKPEWLIKINDWARNVLN